MQGFVDGREDGHRLARGLVGLERVRSDFGEQLRDGLPHETNGHGHSDVGMPERIAQPPPRAHGRSFALEQAQGIFDLSRAAGTPTLAAGPFFASDALVSRYSW